jgi:hypothetical protein
MFRSSEICGKSLESLESRREVVDVPVGIGSSTGDL